MTFKDIEMLALEYESIGYKKAFKFNKKSPSYLCLNKKKSSKVFGLKLFSF